jgi:hypothetical protein
MNNVIVQNPYSISLPFKVNSKITATTRKKALINVSILNTVSVHNLSNLINIEVAYIEEIAP